LIRNVLLSMATYNSNPGPGKTLCFLRPLMVFSQVDVSTEVGNDQASTIIFVAFTTVKIVHTTFYLLDLLHELIFAIVGNLQFAIHAGGLLPLRERYFG
jgi:hypothetical protein